MHYPIKSQLKKFTILVILLGWLAGCASPPLAPPASTSFACNGRFSVRYQEIKGVQSRARNIYGRFAWRDDGKAVTLRLLSPLGQTLAMIQLSALGAVLELPNRPAQVADNADELMKTALGFSLPVTGLRHWLRVPAGGTRREQIRQDGWTIDYLSYTEAPVVRVQRMNLTRDDASIEVKLVLER